jgi:hypothetical protein
MHAWDHGRQGRKMIGMSELQARKYGHECVTKREPVIKNKTKRKKKEPLKEPINGA